VTTVLDKEIAAEPSAAQRISYEPGELGPSSTLFVKVMPAPLPDTPLLLGTVNDRRFRVLKPIPLEIERQESLVVASWPEIEEFGSGDSLSNAIDDFTKTLVELYQSLTADQSRLGPDLDRVFTVLREYLVYRNENARI
jgi:hypothetical protein